MGILTKGEYTVTNLEDGRGISKTESTYQKSTSGTVVPTGTWTTNIPSVGAGEYLWTRTLFTYTDNTTSSTYTVGRMGTNGNNGLGISNNSVHYQASSSGTTAPTGTWTATIPTVAANQYLWTRTTITYTDGSTSVSYSVGKMGADGKDAQLLYLTASSQIQAFDKDDKPKTTQAITISAKLQNASGTATFVAIPYIGNIAQAPITLGGTGNDRTLLPTQWTNTQWTTIAITATLGSLTDTISVIKVKDGATGPKGDDGGQGIQGPPGSDGKPTYIHWAYAWSADGKDRFTTSYPNENLFRNSESPNAISYAGAALTKTTGVSVPEWGATTAVKYAISGGTSTIACAMQGGSNTSAGIKENYDISIYIKNTGSKAFSINGNITSGVRIEPGEAKRVTWLVKDYSHPTGANRQFSINRVVAGEAIEFVIWKAKFAYGTYNSIWTPMPSEDFANAYPIYAGTYTDNELIDSENPADYIWQRVLGDEGESASSYWITPSVNVIKKSMTGLLNPTTITFSAFTKKGLEDSQPYSGRFIIYTSTDGIIWSNRYTATTDSTSYIYTIPSNVNFVRARIYKSGGTSVLLDEVTIPIIDSAEDLVVSERNLLLKSNVPYSATSYGTWWKMTEFMEEGVDYTLKVKGTIGAGKTSMAAFLDGGIINLGNLKDNGDGTHSVTFKGKKGSRTDYNALYIYFIPGSVTATNTIEWIKLVKGNTMFSQWSPAPEEAQLYTAWSNKEDGSVDFTKKYPRENLALNSRIVAIVSNNASLYPIQTTDMVEDGESFQRVVRTSIELNPTIFSVYNTINISEELSNKLKGHKIEVSGMFRASREVNMNNMIVAVYKDQNNTNKNANADTHGKTVKLNTSWQQIGGIIDLTDTANINKITTLRCLPSQATINPNEGFYYDAKNFKFSIIDDNDEVITTYTTPPTEDPVKAEMAYIGYSPKDSNDPADYVWSENPKAKGTFKRWSNDPNGLVDMTDTYPNENLLLGTSNEVQSASGTGWFDGTRATNATQTPPKLEFSTNYTYSAYLTAPSDVDVHIYVRLSRPGAPNGSWEDKASNRIPAGESGLAKVTFSIPTDTTTISFRVLRFAAAQTSTKTIKWSREKLELGSNVTTWTSNQQDDKLLSIPQYIGIGSKDTMNPADFVWSVNPEYTQALVDLGLEDKVDNGSYENDKSDIWEEISNRTTEEEAAAIREMAESIKNSYEAFISSGGQYQLDLEALEARSALLVQNLGDQLATYNFLKTYIKLGEEGLVIGADGSSMKMLLSKDKLSFTDGGQVVAYFSNQSFYINRGAIVDSLQVGQHKMVKLNSDHTVFQWVKV